MYSLKKGGITPPTKHDESVQNLMSREKFLISRPAYRQAGANYAECEGLL